MTVAAEDDVERYRDLLRPIERDARELPWADERPWKASERVGWENGLPIVNLHDLGTAQGAAAVRRVVAAPPACGAVAFVHGRGRHTRTAGSPLRSAVHHELERACKAHPGWVVRLHGMARSVLVTDATLAPPSASGTWSPWLWFWWGLIAAAFVLALARAILG